VSNRFNRFRSESNTKLYKTARKRITSNFFKNNSNVVGFGVFYFSNVCLSVKALKSSWKDHRQRNGLKDEEPVENLLTSIELVLDNHNQLVEMNRLPGENEVTSRFSIDP